MRSVTRDSALLIFFGQPGAVTGSCDLLVSGESPVLLECGLYQCEPDEEALNEGPFRFRRMQPQPPY